MEDWEGEFGSSVSLLVSHALILHSHFRRASTFDQSRSSTTPDLRCCFLTISLSTSFLALAPQSSPSFCTKVRRWFLLESDSCRSLLPRPPSPIFVLHARCLDTFPRTCPNSLVEGSVDAGSGAGRTSLAAARAMASKLDHDLLRQAGRDGMMLISASLTYPPLRSSLNDVALHARPHQRSPPRRSCFGCPRAGQQGVRFSRATMGLPEVRPHLRLLTVCFLNSPPCLQVLRLPGSPRGSRSSSSLLSACCARSSDTCPFHLLCRRSSSLLFLPSPAPSRLESPRSSSTWYVSLPARRPTSMLTSENRPALLGSDFGRTPHCLARRSVGILILF